jgi:plastocyanin
MSSPNLLSPTQSRGRHAALRMLLCFGLALWLCAGSSGLRRAIAKPRTHTVTLRGMKYFPLTLIVSAGDTVVWKNDDIVPHTATARNKSFDSGSIAPGGSWSYVANRKGTYFYYCAFHPNTKGKLIVR